MKIFLIYPPFLEPRVHEEEIGTPPLGLYYVGALLKEKGYEFDKKQITIEEQIKALGIYPVTVKLHPEVEAKIKLWVVKDTNES